MADSGVGPRGRGRGRARASEASQGVAAPPGASVAPRVDRPQTEIGRRGATGRRAEVAAPSTPPDNGKPQRGSPADTGSPNEIDKMAALDLVSLATRPGLGSLGRKYRMFANHFEIGFTGKLLTVYQYHVVIQHSSGKVKLTRDDNRPLFWKCLMANAAQLGLPNSNDLYKVAYDGMHNCYTLNPLNVPRNGSNAVEFEVEEIISKFDKRTKIQVRIQNVGPQIVDLKAVVGTGPDGVKHLTPIQIIDIIIRQFRSNPILDSAKFFYPFKNSVYMIPGTGNTSGGLDLGGGREIWKGLFTSAHVAEGYQALVNMDVSHTGFYKNSINGNGNGNGNGKYPAINFLCDVLNEVEGRQVYDASQLTSTTSLGETQRRMFEREIRGLKVCIDYHKPNTENQNREYSVKGVDKGAADLTFQTREGTQTNVAAYFEQTYGPLRFPRMPTLKVGPKNRPAYLPVEHCFLARNQKVKKLSENQTAIMIRQTCMAPADRKRSIEHMVNLARFNDDPFLQSFGIQLNPQMVQVDGRVLPAPNIGYAQNTSSIRDGVWKVQQGQKFHLPAKAKGIAAVAFGQAPPSAQNFVSQLLQFCHGSGMEVPNPGNVFFHLEQNSTPQRVEIAFKHVAESMKAANLELNLIIVFLQQKGSALYADVKRVAEVQMGIMTQCVTAKTVGKPSPDTLMNIVFKINMKLGGINCILNTREAAAKCLFDAPTLVLGIDVTHPGPRESKSPSVASVVGSMDLTHMRYAASIKVQKQKREMLVYLSDPVTDRLMYFYKETQVKPQRIIVYRDGISEGEFKTVLREELRGIREACLKVDQTYKPKITFIVVQKRHHTRLFPVDSNEGCGKHRNVYPGSVVDNKIVYHEDFVFYLCSHAGIQGTSRPTRYHVLHDDSNFSADEVQMMTYYLCHCYSRCTRAVSIPAPVYFAHLACTRARSHLQFVVGDHLSDTASSASGEGGRQGSSIPEDELIRAATVQEAVRKEMYFT